MLEKIGDVAARGDARLLEEKDDEPRPEADDMIRDAAAELGGARATLRVRATTSRSAGRRSSIFEPAPVPKPNLQPDFNMSVFECFDTSSSAGLRELDESDRSVQKSAESTLI